MKKLIILSLILIGCTQQSQISYGDLYEYQVKISRCELVGLELGTQIAAMQSDGNCLLRTDNGKLDILLDSETVRHIHWYIRTKKYLGTK